jgi:hypothetical protein
MPMNGLYIPALSEKPYLTWRCIWTVSAHKAYSHFYSTCTGLLPSRTRRLNRSVRCSTFAPILIANTDGIARFTFPASDDDLSRNFMSLVGPDGDGSFPIGTVTTTYTY